MFIGMESTLVPTSIYVDISRPTNVIKKINFIDCWLLKQFCNVVTTFMVEFTRDTVHWCIVSLEFTSGPLTWCLTKNLST